jgi:hypothetical protein
MLACILLSFLRFNLPFAVSWPRLGSWWLPDPMLCSHVSLPSAPAKTPGTLELEFRSCHECYFSLHCYLGWLPTPIRIQIGFSQKVGIQHRIERSRICYRGLLGRDSWVLSDSDMSSVESHFGPVQDPVQDQVYAAPWCSFVFLHLIYSIFTVLHSGQISKTTRIRRERSSAVKS